MVVGKRALYAVYGYVVSIVVGWIAAGYEEVHLSKLVSYHLDCC